MASGVVNRIVTCNTTGAVDQFSWLHTGTTVDKACERVDPRPCALKTIPSFALKYTMEQVSLIKKKKKKKKTGRL